MTRKNDVIRPLNEDDRLVVMMADIVSSGSRASRAGGHRLSRAEATHALKQ